MFIAAAAAAVGLDAIVVCKEDVAVAAGAADTAGAGAADVAGAVTPDGAAADTATSAGVGAPPTSRMFVKPSCIVAGAVATGKSSDICGPCIGIGSASEERDIAGAGALARAAGSLV